MITVEKDGCFMVSCDISGCLENDLFDTDGNWREMIASMRGDGWGIEHGKDDIEWVHLCPHHNEKKGE